MEERRQLPRWEIKQEAKVWLPQEQGFSHCIVEDMHLKGMCVSFNKQLSPQEVVRMSFALGDNFDFIKIEAQVSWTRVKDERYVYGLTYSRIADVEKSKIDKYINTNCYDQIKKKWWGK